MTEVHLITSGSYSDYQIIAAFAEKTTAEAICEHYNRAGRGENWGVETLDLIEGEQGEPVIQLTMILSYWANRPYGKDLNESESTRMIFPFMNEAPEKLTCAVSQNNIMVVGTDHDAVRKVYSEKRAEFIAAVNGLTS